MLSDPPHGTERSYNALRLPYALVTRAQHEVRVFLMTDSVGCSVAGQRTPDGSFREVGSCSLSWAPAAA